MMEILPTTRLFKIFEEYPELEEKVMQMAPVFRNLQNPVLRKTVGKLATAEKVAKIGKLDVAAFVNALRQEVGQLTLEDIPEAEPLEIPTGAPDWITGEPQQIINGTEMLEGGVHPLASVNKLMQELAAGKFILLQTNFAPIPLVEAMEKQSYKVFQAEPQPSEHLTYIGKV